MRTNKKMHRLIDITCSVPMFDNQQSKSIFLEELREEERGAVLAMGKALRLLSKGTVYEKEVIELLVRCSTLCDFTATELEN